MQLGSQLGSSPGGWQVPLLSGTESFYMPMASTNGFGAGSNDSYANLLYNLLLARIPPSLWQQFGVSAGGAAYPQGAGSNAPQSGSAQVPPTPPTETAVTMKGDQNIYRFYSYSFNRHFYTRHQSTPKNFGGEGVAFKGFSKPGPDLHPVYHYYSHKLKDNYYSTAPLTAQTAPDLISADYLYGEVLTFISKHQKSGLVPVYSYYSPTSKDHFYTVNTREIGATTVGQAGSHGYICKGILGYASPPY
jgi:hypothetical protein